MEPPLQEVPSNPTPIPREEAMTYDYKVHLKTVDGMRPLCGHPCWFGNSPLTPYERGVTCRLCKRTLKKMKRCDSQEGRTT